jgi:hypothetical protein
MRETQPSIGAPQHPPPRPAPAADRASGHGGSVNGAGSVKFKATGVGEDTTLARIAKLVDSAEFQSPEAATSGQGSRLPGCSGGRRWVATIIGWRLSGGVSFVAALTFAIFGRRHRVP